MVLTYRYRPRFPTLRRRCAIRAEQGLHTYGHRRIGVLRIAARDLPIHADALSRSCLCRKNLQFFPACRENAFDPNHSSVASDRPSMYYFRLRVPAQAAVVKPKTGSFFSSRSIARRAGWPPPGPGCPLERNCRPGPDLDSWKAGFYRTTLGQDHRRVP